MFTLKVRVKINVGLKFYDCGSPHSSTSSTHLKSAFSEHFGNYTSRIVSLISNVLLIAGVRGLGTRGEKVFLVAANPHKMFLVNLTDRKQERYKLNVG